MTTRWFYAISLAAVITFAALEGISSNAMAANSETKSAQTTEQAVIPDSAREKAGKVTISEAKLLEGLTPEQKERVLLEKYRRENPEQENVTGEIVSGIRNLAVPIAFFVLVGFIMYFHLKATSIREENLQKVRTALIEKGISDPEVYKSIFKVKVERKAFFTKQKVFLGGLVIAAVGLGPILYSIIYAQTPQEISFVCLLVGGALIVSSFWIDKFEKKDQEEV